MIVIEGLKPELNPCPGPIPPGLGEFVPDEAEAADNSPVATDGSVVKARLNPAD